MRSLGDHRWVVGTMTRLNERGSRRCPGLLGVDLKRFDTQNVDTRTYPDTNHYREMSGRKSVRLIWCLSPSPHHRRHVLLASVDQDRLRKSTSRQRLRLMAGVPLLLESKRTGY